MKRSRSRVAWEEGRNLASTIPDESDTFDDYTSEEDDSVKGSKEGKESPKGPPGSPSKQLGEPRPCLSWYEPHTGTPHHCPSARVNARLTVPVR